jgi:hypothetical protein
MFFATDGGLNCRSQVILLRLGSATKPSGLGVSIFDLSLNCWTGLSLPPASCSSHQSIG